MKWRLALIGLLVVLLDRQVFAHAAVVRIFADGAYSGTGVVLSKSPPVLATCYHVVQGATSVQVVFDWLPDKVKVVKTAPLPDRDVAFLATDPDVVGVAHDAMALGVPTTNPFDDLAAQYWWSDLDVGNRSNPSNVEIHLPKTLDKLGLYSNPVLKTLGLQEKDALVPVFLVNTQKDPIPGNSGSPIVSNGAVLGLVAGAIDGSRNFFGVTIPTIPPIDGAAWKRVPVGLGESTRYGRRTKGINAYLALRTFKAGSLPEVRQVNGQHATAAKCMDVVESVLGGYQDDLSRLPQMPSDQIPSPCAAYITALRPHLAEQQRQLARAEMERGNQVDASMALNSLDLSLDTFVDLETKCDRTFGADWPDGRSDKAMLSGANCSADDIKQRDTRIRLLKDRVDAAEKRRHQAQADEEAATQAAEAARQEIVRVLRNPPPGLATPTTGP